MVARIHLNTQGKDPILNKLVSIRIGSKIFLFDEVAKREGMYDASRKALNFIRDNYGMVMSGLDDRFLLCNGIDWRTAHSQSVIDQNTWLKFPIKQENIQRKTEKAALIVFTGSFLSGCGFWHPLGCVHDEGEPYISATPVWEFSVFNLKKGYKESIKLPAAAVTAALSGEDVQLKKLLFLMGAEDISCDTASGAPVVSFFKDKTEYKVIFVKTGAEDKGRWSVRCSQGGNADYISVLERLLNKNI